MSVQMTILWPLVSFLEYHLLSLQKLFSELLSVWKIRSQSIILVFKSSNDLTTSYQLFLRLNPQNSWFQNFVFCPFPDRSVVWFVSCCPINKTKVWCSLKSADPPSTVVYLSLLFLFPPHSRLSFYPLFIIFFTEWLTLIIQLLFRMPAFTPLAATNEKNRPLDAIWSNEEDDEEQETVVEKRGIVAKLFNVSWPKLWIHLQIASNFRVATLNMPNCSFWLFWLLSTSTISMTSLSSSLQSMRCLKMPDISKHPDQTMPWTWLLSDTHSKDSLM